MLRIVILGIDPYPKPPGLPAHFIRRHPNGALYPKPFKSKLCLLLAFLILVSLHKRACDAALNEKSLSLCDRLCRAYGIRTRITSVKGR